MQAVKETYEQAIDAFIEGFSNRSHVKFFELEVIGRRYDKTPTEVWIAIEKKLKKKYIENGKIMLVSGKLGGVE